MSFCHLQKVVFVPGLTYIQLLRYAARLRMKTFSFAAIEQRVEQVLSIMNLQGCKHRRLVESPPTRGVAGGELRRLSIACEIVNLPPVLLFEDPTLALEPAVAASIMQCLKNLAKAGHTVVCTMPKPSPQISSFIDNLVVISHGYSIFSGHPSNIERFFCSPEMGYIKHAETHPIDFILDIASGTERPTTQRTADNPAAIQEKFESSPFFEPPVVVSSEDDKVVVNTVRGLPDTNYLEQFLRNTGNKVGHGGNLEYIKWYLLRVYVTIERAIFVKAADTELLKRVWCSSILVGLVVGYLQWGIGSYGYYTTTLLRLPYYDTSNVTSTLFFLSAFTFAQQVLNCQVITQSLQMFRYEQFAGWCPTSGYMLSILFADVPVMMIGIWLFTSIVYFMTKMNYSWGNYLFFVEVLELNAFIGLVTAYLFATILKKEIPVRDLYLFVTFLMIILSGFPFELPYITDYFSDMSQVIPMRWTFESLMVFKFSNYLDGSVYLTGYGFSAFKHYEVFPILGHFLSVTLPLTFLLMLPNPYFLYRKSNPLNQGKRGMSRDSDFGEPAEAIPAAPRPVDNAALQRPLLFNRETSITAKSQLSINVSQSSITGANSNTPGNQQNTDGHGPTVTFHNVTYSVKDRSAPLGLKSILLNVSGQFDWGKLSMVLGASQSGRSSLLHILAGDMGFQSEVVGEILYNGMAVDPKLPLWQRCAFVESHDEQCRDISVRDTIVYAMKLRCSQYSYFKLINDNVQRTIDLLHLNDVVNKKAKNISLGERRRLSIAEEIVAGPTLLMIDEPTTNLGLHDESVMMQCFREMVNQDRTVVASMHSPSYNTFKLFDTLLLLSQGQVIFSGPCSEAAKYFTTMPNPYILEEYRNPADFLVDISGGFLPNANGEFLAPAVLASYCLDRKIMGVKAQVSIGLASANYSPMLEDQLSNSKGRERDLNDVETASNKSPIHSDHSMDLERRSESGRIASTVQVIAAPAFIVPALIGALCIGVYDFFVGLCNTNWEHTAIRISVICERSFWALFNRKKLVLGSLVLHILIACFLGWVLGHSSSTTHIYNLTSFFAISTPGALLRQYPEYLLLVHQPSSFPERAFSRPLLHRFILAVLSVANVLRAHGWRHFLRPNLVCLAGAEPR
jgi:ABC-type multidrug transport system ATPase subunit